MSPDAGPRIVLSRSAFEEHGDRLRKLLAGRGLLVPDDEAESVGSPAGEVVLADIDDGVLERLLTVPGLAWMHARSSGVDHLPLATLEARGVVLTNSAGAHAPAIAEHVVGAMVVLTRGYRTWHEAQQARRWDVVETPPSVLYGKRLGIVGYGAVGRHLAGICKAMGMEVWATRRRPLLPAGEPVDRVLAPGELPELLAASDVVVISPSLNGSTRALIGESELRLLRPSAILINVARGVMLDEEALAHALREQRLAAAMLDVTQVEPLPAESSLWRTPNLLVTPHVAGNTRETWDWAMGLFCANLELFLAGEPDRMANIVDYDAVR